MTLFDELGGQEKIDALVDRMIDLHVVNPTVSTRFTHADLDRGRAMAKEFLAAGAGGPKEYSGKSMAEAHAGMNISEQEYLAVVDDMMAAMTEFGYDDATRATVLQIAFSLKEEIIRV
jgi:hemoglobin